MSMPSGLRYDPDDDFRLLYDEVNRTYHIQQKRLVFGYKFIPGEYRDVEYAKERLRKLRRDNRKHKIKKRYIVIDE